jgi:exodeoxyribonuclease VII small subunit
MPKTPAHPTTPEALAKASAVVSQSPVATSYEAALEEIERLVASLESGEMPLDQLLSGYQRGAALLAFCRDKLEAVENQIKVLDGGVAKPWMNDNND